MWVLKLQTFFYLKLKKGKIAFVTIKSTGLTESELKNNLKLYTAKQVNAILRIIKFLRKCEISSSQLWRIASIALSDQLKAEGLIRNLMGKFKIGLISGKTFLQYVRSQLFRDAFFLYNLFKIKG